MQHTHRNHYGYFYGSNSCHDFQRSITAGIKLSKTLVFEYRIPKAHGSSRLILEDPDLSYGYSPDSPRLHHERARFLRNRGFPASEPWKWVGAIRWTVCWQSRPWSTVLLHGFQTLPTRAGWVCALEYALVAVLNRRRTPTKMTVQILFRTI